MHRERFLAVSALVALNSPLNSFAVCRAFHLVPVSVRAYFLVRVVGSVRLKARQPCFIHPYTRMEARQPGPLLSWRYFRHSVPPTVSPPLIHWDNNLSRTELADWYQKAIPNENRAGKHPHFHDAEHGSQLNCPHPRAQNSISPLKISCPFHQHPITTHMQLPPLSSLKFLPPQHSSSKSPLPSPPTHFHPDHRLHGNNIVRRGRPTAGS